MAKPRFSASVNPGVLKPGFSVTSQKVDFDTFSPYDIQVAMWM